MQLRRDLRSEKLTKPSIHYWGLPPSLAPGKAHVPMPLPIVLTIEETPGGVILFRYDASGSCVGDTWHATVEDAKEQASYEYGIDATGWEEERG